MLVEKELAREAPVKTWQLEGNYQNKDKKAGSSKEVLIINQYTEYTSIDTTCN